MRLVIYLAKDGKSFEVKKIDTNSFELLQAQEAQAIHPVIEQVLSAKGAEEVSSALKILKELLQQDKTRVTSYFFRDGQQVNNYEGFLLKKSANDETIQVSVLHMHGPYTGHNDIKGVAHHETIDEMIDFVENPIPLSQSSCRLV